MGNDKTRTPLNLKALLAPIPQGQATGKDMRYDPLYHEIKEARKEDDPTLSRGIWETELKKADWVLVESGCIDLLTHHTKDLQVAVWLLEAWLMLDGLPGLQRGLDFLTTFTKSFWATLYPPIEDKEAEHRIFIFQWLRKMLLTRLVHTPLTTADTITGAPPYTFGQWLAAHHHETASKRLQNMGKNPPPLKNGVSVEAFHKSLARTPSSFFKELLQDLQVCKKSLTNLKDALDGLFNKNEISFTEVVDLLDQMERVVTPYEKRPSTPPSPKSEEVSSPSLELEESATPNNKTEASFNRHNAYKALKEIALYLEHVEPHSPTPHLLKLISTWEDLTLPEIFQSLCKDPEEYRILLRLLRLEPTKPDEKISLTR